MTREEFAEAHRKVCRKKGSQGGKGACGRALYDYLMKNGYPLDPLWHHKGHGGNVPGVTFVKTGKRPTQPQGKRKEVS